MKLSALLYVSRSTIPPLDVAAGIDAIVAAAHARNPGLGLTGALLFTGEHLAQLLEGDERSIDMLLTSLRRDPRHEHLTIIDYTSLEERRFPDWSLAYFGPSQFVSGHITRLLGDPLPSERGRASEWLADLLWEFSVGSGPA